MTVKELKKLLEDLPDDAQIMVASDEEWNSIYESVQLNQMDDKNIYVFDGCKELEDY